MVASNSVLSEYYSQTKGSNIMFDSDDFWWGALWGSMLEKGPGGPGGDSGWCYTCLCCVGCMGCIACLTGNFGTWCCGVKDAFCGTCTGLGNCCGGTCCSGGPDSFDAAEEGFDQCCEGWCNICCF